MTSPLRKKDSSDSEISLEISSRSITSDTRLKYIQPTLATGTPSTSHSQKNDDNSSRHKPSHFSDEIPLCHATQVNFPILPIVTSPPSLIHTAATNKPISHPVPFALKLSSNATTEPSQRPQSQLQPEASLAHNTPIGSHNWGEFQVEPLQPPSTKLESSGNSPLNFEQQESSYLSTSTPPTTESAPRKLTSSLFFESVSSISDNTNGKVKDTANFSVPRGGDSLPDPHENESEETESGGAFVKKELKETSDKKESNGEMDKEELGASSRGESSIKEESVTEEKLPIIDIPRQEIDEEDEVKEGIGIDRLNREMDELSETPKESSMKQKITQEKQSSSDVDKDSKYDGSSQPDLTQEKIQIPPDDTSQHMSAYYKMVGQCTDQGKSPVSFVSSEDSDLEDDLRLAVAKDDKEDDDQLFKPVGAPLRMEHVSSHQNEHSSKEQTTFQMAAQSSQPPSVGRESKAPLVNNSSLRRRMGKTLVISESTLLNSFLL